MLTENVDKQGEDHSKDPPDNIEIHKEKPR